jgi:hypothetical protein
VRAATTAAFLAMIFVAQNALAEDAAASFLMRHYLDVCVPNVGQPERVRAWANEKHLQEVKSPTALEIVVGAGDKGGAWAVPSSFGSFALSIRGTTQACAVWARAANPADVESYFRKVMEGVKRPGIEVKVDQGTSTPGATGATRLLIYSVSGVGDQTRGFLYTLESAERAGGAFQASLQAARYASP